ncbi:MAG: U32 family peptidase [Spirochaetes bacterium]|nr:U32 family peptidase [Spirochaetota bacterium]MBU1079346.1 U32 family peptidase [Spirochaetota bacterium]
MLYTTAELLAPAGNPEALDAAIGEGADAVYLGLKTFNARMRTSNFAYSQFEAAVESLHKLGKRLYVTVNTVFEQREADRMFQFLQYLERVGPDGIIVQDLGVVKMAQENFPGLKLHASTQMNVGTAAGANFLSKAGFKRVVLSRELSLEELRSVRAETNVELETFVHGALCVSASGVCTFSSYLGGRSANRGACTQACRRLFADESRDGYFFSPDDLQLVEKVPELVEAGIDTFKIEGRMKSSEYVGSVVAAYRYMLDNWRFDRERASAKAASMLQGDFARHKTTFWFDGSAAPDFIRPDQAGGTGISLGKVKVVRVFEEKRWMLVRGFEGIAEGDSIRIHSHGDAGRSTARVRGVMEKPEGLFIQVDAEFGPEDEIYLVQTKSMTRRYKPVLPSSLAKYHGFPSYDKAPRPEFPAIPKDRLAALPDGLYAMVSRVQDLHTILTDRPERAVLRLSRKNAELLRRHEKETPFKRDSLVLWLEPYFPQADAAWLSGELDYWTGKGQRIFVANNLGHLAILKGRDVTVIAGPWLYAFNSWAAAFILSNGADFIVPPLEISKQAFGKLAETVPGKSLFPTVFAYPQLFTIRADLGERFDLRFFRDREGDDYELVSSPDGSVVIPIKPFSLVDRIPFIRKDGATKFMLDFSFIDLKKQVYKRIMAAARDGLVLADAGRFNWKDGFWNPEEERPASKSADSGDRPRPFGDRPRADKAGASDSPKSYGKASAKGGVPAAGAPKAGAPAAGQKRGRPDRPGRGGPPWKVALAERRASEGSAPAARPAGKAPARPKAPRDGVRQSDRTSANAPDRKGGRKPSSRPPKPRGGR